MRWTRACVIPSLWLVACQPQWGLSDCGGDPFVGVVVEEAALVDLSMWQAGLILGGGEGEGRIVGTDVAGNGFVIDVLAQGSLTGAVAEASWQLLDVSVDIELSEGPTPLTELFGNYSGLNVSLGLGGRVRSLENEAGARLTFGALSAGVGGGVSFESLRLIPNGDTIGLEACDDDGVCDPRCFGDPDCSAPPAPDDDTWEEDEDEDEDEDDDLVRCPTDRVCEARCDVDDDCRCPCGDFTCTIGCGGLDPECLPDDWTCAPARYDDGASCDEGCGVADPDCT
jgi:hypothetical protein